MNWRALLLSGIAVCLPMCQLAVTAAETAQVPEGSGMWIMTISPRSPNDSVKTAAAPIHLASFERAVGGGLVPEPIELSDEVDATTLPVITPAREVDPADYRQVYQAIPFLRSEYEANPSYRHEATMEFLFGELRPTVNHRHVGPVRPARIPVAAVSPYVEDRYLGQIPTFMLRYRPPAIPFAGW